MLLAWKGALESITRWSCYSQTTPWLFATRKPNFSKSSRCILFNMPCYFQLLSRLSIREIIIFSLLGYPEVVGITTMASPTWGEVHLSTRTNKWQHRHICGRLEHVQDWENDITVRWREPNNTSSKRKHNEELHYYIKQCTLQVLLMQHVQYYVGISMHWFTWMFLNSFLNNRNPAKPW